MMAARRRRSTRSCRTCGRGGRGHQQNRRSPDWGWYLIVAVLVMIYISENPGVIR